MSDKRVNTGDGSDRVRPSVCGADVSERVTAVNEQAESLWNLTHFKDLPPIEVRRMDGESNEEAARRFLDVQYGCYGD